MSRKVNFDSIPPIVPFNPYLDRQLGPFRTSSMPLSDELEKLHALKQSGVLTDAEFESAKKRILQTEEPPAARASRGGFGSAQTISKGFYRNSICGGLWFALLTTGFSLLGLFASSSRDDVQVFSAMLFVGVISLIFSTVMLLSFVSRMWASLPYGSRRTSPAAAVCLLFLPLFNLYWCFQVYAGWCEDFNNMAKSEGLELPRMPEDRAFTLCFFMILSCLPYIGIPFLFVNLFVLAGFISKASDGINALARHNALARQASTSTEPSLGA